MMNNTSILNGLISNLSNSILSHEEITNRLNIIVIIK